MISHHASHRGRYVRPPTPRSAPGRLPHRPPRRVVGNSCLVLRRSAAAPSLRARGPALRHHPGVADADRGDARSRPEPSPPAPPARPAATPALRHPGAPAPRHPALRVASRCGQFLPGVAPSCASPGTPGPGFGAAAPARSCRHECATTRAHDARRTSARHGPDATCTSALPSPARGTQTRAVVGSGRLSRRGRPGGRSRDRPVDRRGPTGPPRRAARRGAARPPARPVGRGRRCGRCGTASRRAPPRTAT